MAETLSRPCAEEPSYTVSAEGKRTLNARWVGGGRDVQNGGTTGPSRGQTQPFLPAWTRKGLVPRRS